MEKDAAAGRAGALASSAGGPAVAAAAEEAAVSSAAPPSDGSYSPMAASTGSAPGSGRRSFSGSPRGAAPSAARAAPTAEPSAAGVAAVNLAVQLEDVAGGADSGLLAEAAVALRELAKRDAELAASQQVGGCCSGRWRNAKDGLALVTQRWLHRPACCVCCADPALHATSSGLRPITVGWVVQEAARLRSEVDELNDTMFSKTFKPPSAWAGGLGLLRPGAAAHGVLLLWGAAAATLLAGLLERAGGCVRCILVDTHVPLGLGKLAAPSSPAPLSPSALLSSIAEREIKYKQDKKYWEEQQKELAARVAALAAERDALRGGSGAQQLEERIQASRCCLAWNWFVWTLVCRSGSSDSAAQKTGGSAASIVVSAHHCPPLLLLSRSWRRR